MGIEFNINDNPFTMDILWGTARQVMDICLGDSDLKDFIRQF